MPDSWEAEDAEFMGGISASIDLPDPLAPPETIRWRRLDLPQGDYTRPTGQLAHFAHDFLQPLTALRLGLSEVEQAIGPQEAGGASMALRDLEAAYQQMMELVQALRDADQLDSQDLQPRHGWVDVSGLSVEVVRSFQPTARARRTTVGVNLPKGRVWAMTDRHLLRRLLSNLVDNAIRHGRSGGRVVVHAEVEGELLRLRVEDDGPGLPEALTLTPTGTSRARGGQGLGLLLCARVARLLSGHLCAGDGPGGRFMLEIPGCAKLR